MTFRLVRNFFFACLCLLSTGIFAQVPPPAEPMVLYNNFSKEFPDFLSRSEADSIERKLERFSNETTNQICVVIVDDLNGLTAEQYATAIGNTWKLGLKDKNNGVVVLIKPTNSGDGRDLFIATGYGLEGAIPDLMANRVVRYMTEYLKNGQNFDAVNEGTDLLMKMATGDYHEKDTRPRAGRKNTRDTIRILIIIVVIIAFLIWRRGGGGGYNYGRRGRRFFYGGGWGGFGGGSWGGGSSSGGSGWGGFGGGSFGGGGSGGKW